MDIVSELIDRQLEPIAGDILSILSDMDISNAIVANPKGKRKTRVTPVHFISGRARNARIAANVLSISRWESREAFASFPPSSRPIIRIAAERLKKKIDGGELFSTVYKASIEADSVAAFSCIAHREPLHARGLVVQMRSAPEHDCIAMVIERRELLPN